MKRPRRNRSRKANVRNRTRRLRKEPGTGEPTFHILIASAGRPSLHRIIKSLKPQLCPGDALTIVFDGKDAPKKAGFMMSWVEGFTCAVKVEVEEPAGGSWGHVIRNKYTGQRLTPRTTFIMHADDDDMYLRGAFDNLRKVCTNPRTLYVAKMKYANDPGKVVPTQNRKILAGDIGNPNGIIPWDDSHTSKWTYDYLGDFEYYNGLAPKVAAIKFLPNIIYLVGGS